MIKPRLSADETRSILDHMAGAAKSASPVLQAAVDDLIAHPGKLLRPTLVILAARLARETAGEPLPETLYRIAAGVELLHLATLVHDDIIDQAAIRRQRPTVFARFGARVAVLVGDHLCVSAFRLVADLGDQRTSLILAQVLKTICAGEALQMGTFNPARPSVRRYLQQIVGKTAALFAAACRAGSEPLSLQPQVIQSLQRAGYNLGMAFQIIDDILDFYPDDRTSGKTPGRDLSLGLLTLPVLEALKTEQGQGGRQSGLGRLLNWAIPSRISQRLMAKIRARITVLGGFAAARQRAAIHAERAKREIRRLPDSPDRQAFLDLIEELQLRTA